MSGPQGLRWLSAPLVFLLVFAVLLALAWLPGRWRAVPLFLLAMVAAIGLVAGIAEIPLGSGPFAYDIGPLGTVLWVASIAAALGVVVLGLLEGVASLRR